jgi:hypothetical protein
LPRPNPRIKDKSQQKHNSVSNKEFRSAASTLELDVRYLVLCILLEDDPSAIILKQLGLNFGEETFPVVTLIDWSNFGMIRITE